MKIKISYLFDTELDLYDSDEDVGGDLFEAGG
jgi:hypothetical protein